MLVVQACKQKLYALEMSNDKIYNNTVRMNQNNREHKRFMTNV